MSFQMSTVADYNLTNINLQSLLEMIIIRRPARSEGEYEMIERFIDPIKGMVSDDHGNRILRIGEAPVLWSSHTDTVHTNRSSKYQRINIDNGIISLQHNSGSNCLGADCTAGVWIMLEMIKAGIEGLYIFHRDEEVGGLGSTHFAKTHSDLLEEMKFAIAFDRKGSDSVITHQCMERCASEAFVRSITPMLPKGYASDDGGTFTDTANYTGIISECTNLSVGYYGQHTSAERLDLHELLRLRQSMMTMDLSKLVASRDPSVTEYNEYYGYDRYACHGYGYGNYGGYGNGKKYRSGIFGDGVPGNEWMYGDEDDDDSWKKNRDTSNVIQPEVWTKNEGKKQNFRLEEYLETDGDGIDPNSIDYGIGNCRTLKEFLQAYPDEAADYLEQQGFNVEDLYAHAPWLP